MVISLFFCSIFTCLKSNELVLLGSINSAIVTSFADVSSLQYYRKLPDFFKWLSMYSIKLYIGLTALMSLALSTSILLTLIMQSAIEAQFSNIAFSYQHKFALASTSAVVATDIV